MKKLRILLIITAAAVMALIGLNALETYAGDSSLAHPGYIAALSAVLWLAASALGLTRRLLAALVFGAVSPFIGALLYVPHPASLVYMAEWSPVAIPVGIATGVIMWAIQKRFMPVERKPAEEVPA